MDKGESTLTLICRLLFSIQRNRDEEKEKRRGKMEKGGEERGSGIYLNSLVIQNNNIKIEFSYVVIIAQN